MPRSPSCERSCPADATAAAAPALDRGPEPRRRRAAARDRAGVRPGVAARAEEAADAPRPHGRQPLLRVLDADVVELRARRQAPVGRRHVDQGRRLLGRQGRVPQGHGADAERLRPGRDRHPARRDRRAAARRRGRPARTSSTPATASTSTRPRRCSTCTRSSRSSVGSRGSTWRSSATCCTRGSRARTSRRSSCAAPG